MKKYLILIPAFFFSACSNKTEGDQFQSGPGNAVASTEANPEYRLIRDNLYSDSSGNLYLKSWTREHFETGKRIDVWIKAVYCDTCRPLTDDVNVETELKDFVDTATFHLDSTDNVRGGDFYEDKDHRYFHKWMADGGTISIVEE